MTEGSDHEIPHPDGIHSDDNFEISRYRSLRTPIDDRRSTGNRSLLFDLDRTLFALEEFGFEQVCHSDDPFEGDRFEA